MNGFEVDRRLSYYFKGYVHTNHGRSSADVHITEEEFIELRDSFINMHVDIANEKITDFEISILLDAEEIERRIKNVLGIDNIELRLPDREFSDDEFLWILGRVMEKEDAIWNVAKKKKCILTLNVVKDHA